MGKVEALKKYFESNGGRHVSNSEIIILRKDDPKGYDEMAADAAKELGVTLD